MFQSTFKNFNFNFNSSNEGNTVSSGDLLTGHISFDLTKPTKIRSITMSLTGGVRVYWSTGSGKNRRSHSARLTFFDLKTVLQQDQDEAVERPELSPGTHMYPFSCQIPQGDFPPTFNGAHGQVIYVLTVGINRPWHMAKTFQTDLNFVSRVDTSQPDLPLPLSGSNRAKTCNLWCTSGEVTLAARTEKKAFIPGETAKIICDFSNGSSKTATLKVKLQQQQTYYTHNRVSRRTVFKELASEVGDPVAPYTSDQHAEVMITIPSPLTMSITNCSILELEYLIQVSLCVKPCTDVMVLFPIVLCDTPVEARFPF
ncbi:arrestin domain-containing protein 3-like [Salarias fasciatus]|uniref:Arrestin domain-containing protein 3-like n=1 Tax=Salarias fasciatus TaxID=181472 RepID=A0A672G1Z0_SALFA|nr:arrestin domain-containing protein 3-like [Salarias fasciatus]